MTEAALSDHNSVIHWSGVQGPRQSPTGPYIERNPSTCVACGGIFPSYEALVDHKGANCRGKMAVTAGPAETLPQDRNEESTTWSLQEAVEDVSSYHEETVLHLPETLTRRGHAGNDRSFSPRPTVEEGSNASSVERSGSDSVQGAEESTVDRKQWSPSDIEALERGKAEGKTVKEISAELGNHSTVSCRIMYGRDPRVPADKSRIVSGEGTSDKRGTPFTEAEDIKLAQYLASGMFWSEVAKSFPYRDGNELQIR